MPARQAGMGRGIAFAVDRMPDPRHLSRMAASTTLNAVNLEKLGAPALAALLVEVATGNAAIKRRLRLALADAAGPSEIAAQVRKRLATVAKARSGLDWQQVRALAADLATQHAAIAGPLAAADPAQAHTLLWDFLALADRLYDRTDDGGGRLGDVFRAAAADLPRLVEASGIAAQALADRLFDLLDGPPQDHRDDLIALLAPRLGAVGFDRLRRRIADWTADAPEPQAADIIGYGPSGPIYYTRAGLHRPERRQALLRAIADAQGDIDAYVALHPEPTRSQPLVATAIARRLLDRGRPAEALAALDRIGMVRAAFIPADWDAARLEALDALGRGAEAQALRWARFEATLHAGHLRDHLRRLPDFDDFEAEQRALSLVEQHRDLFAAIAFLIEWPAHERAARMVLARRAELDGDRYEVLTEAADRLDAAHPLAATLLRRAMIDFALGRARASRYGHAARHLADCAAADARIADYGRIPDHATYVATLREAHGRKVAFWA